jgi:uncharacterized ubiquitin-like protein YukD
MSMTRNSICTDGFLLFKEYENYLKDSSKALNNKEKLEESINLDLKNFNGKMFYHASIKNPEISNYSNYKKMIINIFEKEKINTNPIEVQKTINEIALKLAVFDLNIRQVYFGKYAFSTKEQFIGKIIGGSYNRSKLDMNNGILDLVYNYHFDLLVPAPVYSKEYSDIKKKDLKNRPLTPDDIIRPDGLGQTTLTFYTNLSISYDSNNNTYQFNFIEKDSGNAVILDDKDYNIIKFFERIKNCYYPNKTEVLSVCNLL